MEVCYDVSIVRAAAYQEDIINAALDTMFAQLGMDTEDPFADIIKPGMRVFIKPNWVASRWRKSCDHEDTIYSVITHPSVVEAVADRVVQALKGRGELVIGDNPSIDADFDELMELTQLKRLETKYDVPCRIMDLRPLICTDLKFYGKRDMMTKQTGDPLGEVQVNLGRKSLFHQIDPSLFRGVFDERDETIAAHSGETQLYSYGRSLYDADVYISIPKLKTHQKVGATLNLKGLVGAVTQKNQLIHWRVGYPEIGGDEYPSAEAWEAGQRAKVTHRGAWVGNDSIWRMVVDLYHGLRMRERKYFSIIDGIIGGEGRGPFCPYAKNSQVLIGGSDLPAVDIAAIRLMGLSPYKIPYIKYLIETGETRIEHIRVHTFDYPNEDFFSSENRYLDFQPASGWESIRI